MEVVNLELSEDQAIVVDALSIVYRSMPKGIFNKKKEKLVKALTNVSFTINRGEVVALLGRNGSGKTTLLQTIGGAFRPETGSVHTRGRVYTLKGSDPGLIGYISSRENVRLMSAIYGVPEEELEEFEKEVEDFCELGEAYDRDYSSLSTGMAGRVGFGFTTGLKPEILLMDETLGVGDVLFRKKAEKKATQFMERGETILLSTHSLGLAKKMCRRGLVLEDGNLIFDGTSEDAVAYYLESIENSN